MKKRGNRKIGNRKAISNIEMSVAIILFVVAVFSIILIFNVYSKPDKIDSSILDDFEKSFLENADDFTKVGVNVNSLDCINIPLNKNIGSGSIGVFLNNKQVGSRSEGDRLYFDGFLGRYYEIYDFPITNIAYQTPCDESNYNYTIPVQGEIFLENKFNQIASSLNNANFVVKNCDNDPSEIFNANKNPPEGAEVLAKTFFILVYHGESGNERIKNCQVNIQVWR